MTDCTLCGLPTPDPPVTDGDVDGAFCCRGCLEVARTVPDATEAAAEDDPTAALDRGEAAAESAGETAFLSVAGMHCGTCEAFVESRLTDAAGVTGATASYPTGTAKVTYDPERRDRASLPDLVAGVGYSAELGAEAETEEETTGRLLVGGLFGMMTMAWYVLFLYPAYLGLDADLLFVDPASAAGTYLLGNVLVMTAVVLGYTGWPILRGAYVSLRAGQPNMDLLVGLAATAAFSYSVVLLALGRTEVYFDVTTVIVLAVTVGDHYKERVRSAATDRLADLQASRVTEARRVTDGGTERVAVDDLAAGDRVRVEAGERVPIDGTVVAGTAAVSEALVTGESLPERRTPGEAVIGGARVTDGAVTVEVGPDAESTVDRLVETLWEVQSGGDAGRLVDRVARVFVPVVVALAAVTTVAHLALGATATAAVLVGLSVLVVSCPCALGLATPLATARGIKHALGEGVVLTGTAAIERAGEVDVVALDKTGTLTTGEMRLLERPDGDLLAAAAAVEREADHPLAGAIRRAADAPADAEDVTRHPGRGVGGRVDGRRVLVGTPALFESEGWTVPERLAARCERARSKGRVPALVGREGEAEGVVVAGDRPRPEWASVVSDLADSREVVVITGDGEAAARPFRDHGAVDEVFADVPPEAKAAVVDRLRERGTVAMVGDGSNDAPALAGADVGIAVRQGTKLAVDAADAVVTTDDLGGVEHLFETTRATRRRLRQNLGWALCYNAVAVPLAVAGVLNPLFAAVAMVTSSLLVVANSARPMGSDGDATGPDGDGPTRDHPERGDAPREHPEDEGAGPEHPESGDVERASPDRRPASAGHGTTRVDR